MKQIKDDEIDIFTLIFIVWDEKWIITIFTFLALLFGSVLLLLSGFVYESKMAYTLNVTPPEYTNKKSPYKPYDDFKNLFFSVDAFNKWKKATGNSSLLYKDFSPTAKINGYILLNPKWKRMVSFTTEEKYKKFILIKSKDLEIVNSYFQYAQHINNKIKSRYKLEAINLISSTKEKIKENNTLISADILTDISVFIYRLDNSEQLFTISHPSIPKRISPKIILTLIISIIIGTITGFLFIFIRKAFKKRNNH